MKFEAGNEVTLKDVDSAAFYGAVRFGVVYKVRAVSENRMQLVCSSDYFYPFDDFMLVRRTSPDMAPPKTSAERMAPPKTSAERKAPPKTSAERMAPPKTSAERKAFPVFDGCLQYFPASLMLISKMSKKGNDKHNPGQPMHWARGKSTDQENCIVRHLMEAGEIDPETNLDYAVAMAWRALAKLQILAEEKYGWPVAPGAKK